MVFITRYFARLVRRCNAAFMAVLLLVAVMVFTLTRLAAGDPVAILLGDQATAEDIAQARVQYGLDQPLLHQFAYWLKEVAHGNLGQSIFLQRPVTQALAERAEPTFFLALFAVSIAALIGIPCGLMAAVWRGRLADQILSTVAMLGALDLLTPGKRTPHEIALLAHRVETEKLGLQCGIQDQLCSAYGGICFIEMFQYPLASVSQILVSNNIWWELERRLVDRSGHRCRIAMHGAVVHQPGQHEGEYHIGDGAERETPDQPDRHVAPRIAALLGRRRDRIEADIGEEQHPRRADDP